MINIYNIYYIISILLITKISLIISTVSVGQSQMIVQNNCGDPIDLYWVNVNAGGTLTKQLEVPIRNSSQSIINSYEGHEFVVKIVGDDKKFARWRHSGFDEIIEISSNFDGSLNAKIKNDYQLTYKGVEKGLDECRKLSRRPKKFASKEAEAEHKEKYVECISKHVGEATKEIRFKMQREKAIKTGMADLLRNYTCADPLKESSIPIRKNKYWRDTNLEIQYFLEEKHAQVGLVENFITEEDCKLVRKRGEHLLREAAVAGDDGIGIISETRKAKAALVSPKWDDLTDPVTKLYKRAFDFINHVGHFNLNFDGQEDFNLIKYDVGDQYRPHCDGSCEGIPHRRGGRVGTMVFYCEAAEKGGGTTFSKANVFVKPKKHSVAWFTYRGNDDIMDDGLTEHSGCPVLEGSKWIFTMWFRDGVSSDYPWSYTDPSGVPIEESKRNF